METPHRNKWHELCDAVYRLLIIPLAIVGLGYLSVMISGTNCENRTAQLLLSQANNSQTQRVISPTDDVSRRILKRNGIEPGFVSSTEYRPSLAISAAQTLAPFMVQVHLETGNDVRDFQYFCLFGLTCRLTSPDMSDSTYY